MAKRGHGGLGALEGGSEHKKNKQTQQNGSAREHKEDNDATPPTTSRSAAPAAPAAVGSPKPLAKGKGKSGDKEKSTGKESSSGGSANNNRRRKKVHEEAGYEGPVLEESDSELGVDARIMAGDERTARSARVSPTSLTRTAEGKSTNTEAFIVESTATAAGEAGDQQTVVDVCLDFCDPHERFFHGIRALVGHSYLQDAAGAGLSPLVDLAVAQGAVGTVLSTDADGDAVFGFVTALPVRHLARENKCMQEVTKYLLSKAAKAGRGPEMEEVLGESAQGKVGLLVSERMINCPMQAVPKLHEALVEDIAWAIDNEISEEHRDKFRFDKFVVVAPCDDACVIAGPAMLSDFYFSRFDDEVLLQEADFFFPMGGGPQQRYVVGVMPASKLRDCAQGIAQMVG
ncbi:unnamed protein product [Scytosiphon promiscuus]